MSGSLQSFSGRSFFVSHCFFTPKKSKVRQNLKKTAINGKMADVRQVVQSKKCMTESANQILKSSFKFFKNYDPQNIYSRQPL